MFHKFVAPVVLIFFLNLPASVSTAIASDPEHFPLGRPLDITHIKLDMRVDLKDKTVQSRATVDGTALRRQETIRFDAVDFDVHKVSVQLRDASPRDCTYQNDGRHLTLELPQPLELGGKIQVVIKYSLADPTDGLHFFAPSEEQPDAPLLMWSQGESISNRYWVPCFDHPNEKQTTEIACTVQRPNIAISNGKLIGVTKNSDDTRTYHWLQRQPHVAYLMTLVVGEFTEKTVTWRGRPVTYYVREKYKDWIDNSFSKTPAMLDFFSNKIGVEYPWDKYDQICCYSFGGGMENTSATTLGERTLHDDRAHLDTSSDGLVAHELAHQWWGDLLTCTDWAHIWLNEGFASYFQALWTEEDLGADEFAYDMLQKARRAIKGGKKKPIVYRNYDNPGEQFDSRAYPKGAWVLHMIRRKLGDEMFWKAIESYCKANSYQTVETFDLRKAIEQVSGFSFERFFYDWTDRSGSPKVKIKYRWLAKDKLAKITVRQTQDSSAFHFPLKIEFRFDGDHPPFVFSADIDEKQASFFIPLKQAATMVRVDPDNAVLMQRTEDKPRNLWVEQLLHDPNVVARIAAVEHFGKEKTSPDRKLLAERLADEPFWGVQSAIAKQLGKLADDDETNVAKEALLAGLKIENPKSRSAVVEALGEYEEESDVVSALLKIAKDGDPSYRVHAAAIVAYADVAEETPADLLDSLLATESYRHTIRVAALRAIGSHCDADRFDRLEKWSQIGRPLEARTAAIEAIGKALAGDDLDDASIKRSLNILKEDLKSKSRWVQWATLGALEEAGPKARSLLPQIDRLAKEGNLRVQRIAVSTAAKIREQVSPELQLDQLRKQLVDLQQQNEDLVERLNKLEATESSEQNKSVQASAAGD